MPSFSFTAFSRHLHQPSNCQQRRFSRLVAPVPASVLRGTLDAPRMSQAKIGFQLSTLCQSKGAESFHSAAVGGGFTGGIASCQRLEPMANAPIRIVRIRRRLTKSFNAIRAGILQDGSPDRAHATVV